MLADLDFQLKASRDWAQSACQEGWLSETDIAPLFNLQNRSPSGLFEPGAHRPLVAAFFGGTGVGKSSLLNRLAGQPIAKVGVERPTSREVSLYLHESLQLRQLPEGFPVERVRIARHSDERRRGVLWVDMPDIDSTETYNRDLVTEWLPHIDVLIYVVSPERYRDDKAWCMLKQHVKEHAWLFVINQWDRGQEAQQTDFRKLLQQGGFADPVVFRTDCRLDPNTRKPDQFIELESTLQGLADNHLIEQLELRALAARRATLQDAVNTCLSRLRDESALERLREAWQKIGDETVESLLRGLEWPVAEVARTFVYRDASPLRRSIKLKPPEQQTTPAKPAEPSLLWDDWAQMQWQDGLDRLMMEAGDHQFPLAPLRNRLINQAESARKKVLDEAQLALRLSLARPGNAVQRFFLKLTGFCQLVLPLTAICWVSWQAVYGYYESALTHQGFLGVDFATHSVLIVALSWLLPFFINHQLRPSTERAARRGLHKGISAGLARLQAEVDTSLQLYGEGLGECRQAGLALLPDSPAAQVTDERGLERLLPKSISSD